MESPEEQIQPQKSIQCKRPKLGRPSVITEAVVRNLEKAFESGMNDTTACQHAQISRETFYKELREDEEFANKIATAKNFLKLLAGKRLVHILEKGTDRDAVPLIKFTLEKLEPEQFGNKGGVVINQNFGYKDPIWWTPPTDII